MLITNLSEEESAFTGAIYQPGAYLANAPDPDAEVSEDGENSVTALNNQQRNMYKFIRRLLVRRFESSFGALEKTLNNLIRTHQSVSRLATPEPLGRGIVVLDRALMDKLLNLEDASDEEVSNLLQNYEDDLILNGDNTRKKPTNFPGVRGL
ncbi:MAG: hypothetical protein WC340_11725 [Kiritimatiellia bacterium]